MKAINVLDNLETIRNKGNYFWGYWRAKRALNEIECVLSKEDYHSINVALMHKLIGEGSDELNGILTKVRGEYGRR